MSEDQVQGDVLVTSDPRGVQVHLEIEDNVVNQDEKDHKGLYLHIYSL